MIVEDLEPEYYKFPNLVEAVDIAQHLSYNGGTALAYIIRSTRLDGIHKGQRIEDLHKAQYHIGFEIDRLTSEENG